MQNKACKIKTQMLAVREQSEQAYFGKFMCYASLSSLAIQKVLLINGYPKEFAMLFKKRTLYNFGFIAGLCTAIASVLLIAGVYLGIMFTIASVLGSAMMFFITPSQEKPINKILCLFASVCLIFAMVGGSPQTLQGALASIAGAISWPVFALVHIKKSSDENIINTVSNLVIIAGVVQLVFSFVPLDENFIVVMAAAIGAAQSAFAFVLKNAQPTSSNSSKL